MKKEILDGVRNYRFLIIFFALLFFAVLDPVMTKYILPEILKSQFDGMTPEMMAQMVDMTQRGAIVSYLGDAKEISSIVIVFVLSGLLARELTEKTLILPICSGKKFTEIVLSKIVVFGAFTMFTAIFTGFINFFYASILFTMDITSIWIILKSSLIMGIMLMFMISIILLTGVFVRKAIVSGLLTLGFIYLQGIIGGLFIINQYLPTGLYSEMLLLTETISKEAWISLTITILLSVTFTSLSIIRLRKMEIAFR
ncbi:MAG: hypothetical protein JXQ23_10280 [Clostridia bacterium]|nr:hypothetical protein [Clostridia bacterium]